MPAPTHTVIGSAEPAKLPEPRYSDPTLVFPDIGKGDRNVIMQVPLGPWDERSPFANLRGGNR
jgi:hypothetical protein